MNTTELATTLDGITVWDGTRSLGASSVRWSADRIEHVVSAADRHPGLSLIPGLIDTHVHLDTSILDGSGPGDAWPLVTPEEEKALHVAAHSLKYATFGMTTLRDLAAAPVQIAVGRAFDQGVLQGPRLLSSGPVGMTAGHGDLFTPPRYRHRPPVADSPDECRRLVRQWAREGATGIKIYTSGGIFSMGDHVGWRNHTRAELAATIDEAHALQMLVAAHTHTAEGIEIALDEGADSIEHATGITPAIADRLAEARIPVAPTLLINTILARGGDGIRAEATAKATSVIAERDPAFLQAGRAGVRFVLGTDANGKFVRHGDQLEELQMMAAAFDWSSERTLQAATSDAADALGLGSTVGTIVPGHAADFVIVRGHPWEDIAQLTADNIVAVVSRGRVLSGRLP